MKELTKTDVERVIEEDKVSLDDAWEWIGYSSKQKAKQKLESYLEEGIDYTLNQMVKSQSNGKEYPIIDIQITKDAFKELCMVANTEKGKEVRRYFIEIEKQYKNQSIGSTHKDRFRFHMMKALAELEERQDIIEENQRNMERSYRKRVLQPKIEAPKYYTIKGWVSMHHEDFPVMDKGDYISLGRQASRLSKNQLYDIKFIEDAEYGSVNSYHIDILKQL